MPVLGDVVLCWEKDYRGARNVKALEKIQSLDPAYCMRQLVLANSAGVLRL